MTKDELIYKLKYIPGDIHILIHFNNNISNGFYEIDNKITFFADLTPNRIPYILLTTYKEIDVNI